MSREGDGRDRRIRRAHRRPDGTSPVQVRRQRADLRGVPGLDDLYRARSRARCRWSACATQRSSSVRTRAGTLQWDWRKRNAESSLSQPIPWDVEVVGAPTSSGQVQRARPALVRADGWRRFASPDRWPAARARYRVRYPREQGAGRRPAGVLRPGQGRRGAGRIELIGSAWKGPPAHVAGATGRPRMATVPRRPRRCRQDQVEATRRPDAP